MRRSYWREPMTAVCGCGRFPPATARPSRVPPARPPLAKSFLMVSGRTDALAPISSLQRYCTLNTHISHSSLDTAGTTFFLDRTLSTVHRFFPTTRQLNVGIQISFNINIFMREFLLILTSDAIYVQPKMLNSI